MGLTHFWNFETTYIRYITVKVDHNTVATNNIAVQTFIGNNNSMKGDPFTTDSIQKAVTF